MFAGDISERSYIVILDKDSSISISDSSFYNISKKIIFPVSKYIIPENSTFRHEFLSDIQPYLSSNSYRLESVMLRGAASPEGPYGWNQTLSRMRAKSILDIINSSSSLATSGNVLTKEVAEDYVYLLLLMRERNDKDYALVEDIVNQYLHTDQLRLKEELQRALNGKLWKRLLKEYFPAMRTARIVLVFKKHHELPKTQLSPASFYDSYLPTEPQAVGNIKTPVRLPRRELLSVKTNLLLDFAYMPGGYNRFCPIPNVALEYYPLHGHFTYGASFDCPWWQDYDSHKYFQVRNYQLETRYYFQNGDVNKHGYGNGPAFKGMYLQAYAHAALYGICFDENRGWEGEGIGAGLGVGYVVPISKKGRWRLEFSAQFGFFLTKYDPYQYECPVDPTENDNLYYYKWTLDGSLFKERQYRFTWFGPTRVGITIGYDLLFRKRLKKGVGIRRFEY